MSKPSKEKTSTARKLVELLIPLAEGVDPPNAHWIGGVDYDGEYCRECAEKNVAERFAEDPDSEAYVDGGWGGNEEDGPCWCQGCGILLSYCLTNCGQEEEIAHWRDTSITSPEDAYMVVTMLNGYGCPCVTEASYDGEIWLPEAKQDVLKMYRRFVREQKAKQATKPKETN